MRWLQIWCILIYLCICISPAISIPLIPGPNQGRSDIGILLKNIGRNLTTFYDKFYKFFCIYSHKEIQTLFPSQQKRVKALSTIYLYLLFNLGQKAANLNEDVAKKLPQNTMHFKICHDTNKNVKGSF